MRDAELGIDGWDEMARVIRSYGDHHVWLPSIPGSDIASSEGHAVTSLRRAKKYVEQQLWLDLEERERKWVKDGEDAHVLMVKDD